jgi:hypothetical protein
MIVVYAVSADDTSSQCHPKLYACEWAVVEAMF